MIGLWRLVGRSRTSERTQQHGAHEHKDGAYRQDIEPHGKVHVSCLPDIWGFRQAGRRPLPKTKVYQTGAPARSAKRAAPPSGSASLWEKSFPLELSSGSNGGKSFARANLQRPPAGWAAITFWYYGSSRIKQR